MKKYCSLILLLLSNIALANSVFVLKNKSNGIIKEFESLEIAEQYVESIYNENKENLKIRIEKEENYKRYIYTKKEESEYYIDCRTYIGNICWPEIQDLDLKLYNSTYHSGKEIDPLTYKSTHLYDRHNFQIISQDIIDTLTTLNLSFIKNYSSKENWEIKSINYSFDYNEGIGNSIGNYIKK